MLVLFKVFMFAVVMVIPVSMLWIGYCWKTHPPEKINGIYGYRTRRSMFNKQTWDYAHTVYGRIERITGWLLLGPSLFAGVLVSILNGDVCSVGVWSGLVVLMQSACMIIPLPITERCLKDKFGI